MRITDLKLVTPFINPNEGCYGILDIDMQTEDFKALHRYRLTYVIRDDKPTAYVQDLSDMKQYNVLQAHPPVQVFTLMEHTVAESWDIANAAYDQSRAKERLIALGEEAKEKSIVTAYWERMAMANEYIKRNPRTAAKVEEYRG